MWALALKAILFILIGVVTYFISYYVSGYLSALRLTPSLVIASTVFFAMSVAGTVVYKFAMQDGGSRAIGFYLLAKVVRLAVAVILILAYTWLDGSSIPTFAIYILALYLVSMTVSLVFHVKVEQNIKKK